MAAEDLLSPGQHPGIEVPAKPGPAQFTDGLVDALREVAAHLRQGDYLPGSALYDETVGPNWPDPTE
jgi:hypothetical protein